jgi:hypothetical protein
MKQKCMMLVLISMFAFTNVNAQKKKVAVVTFYANTMVEFAELEIGSEELIKNVLELRDNPDFNLAPMLANFHQNFFKEYSNAFPFELIPEKEVLESEAYKNFQPKYELNKFDARDYLVQEGYKYIYEGFMGKANEEGLAKAMGDKVDGIMFVNINFAFEKGFGVGKTMSIKMRATTRMALYNKKGEKVFAFSENERSKKTGVMVGGIPIVTPEKVLPMCQSALDELMVDLEKRIDKIIKKTNAKL